MVESQAAIREAGNEPAHINDIPFEILSQVFALAVSSFIHHPERRASESLTLYPLVVLPSVCTRWRHISTGTRSLWSYIDIREEYTGKGNNDGLLERTRLWLERAHGIPLRLVVQGKQDDDAAKELASILRPHIAYVTSLHFEETSEVYFCTILGLFASYNFPGMLNTLVADRVYGYWSRYSSQGADTATSLNASRVIWPIGALQGIMDLQFNYLPLPVCPSLGELVVVLSNSRRLQTLGLRGMWMFPGGEVECSDISLPHLTLLDLSLRLGCDPGLHGLISALIPGTLGLEVRLWMPNPHDHECNATVQALLRRSYVTSLVVRNLGVFSARQFASYIECLPHLQELILIYLPDENCVGLEALTKLDGPEVSARCPSLRSLSIIGCDIGPDARRNLRQVAACHRLKELIFGHGTVFVTGRSKFMGMNHAIGSDDGTESDEGDDDAVIDNTFKWLRQRVEHVVHNSRFRGPR